MGIVVFAALVLYGIEFVSLINLRREAKEIISGDYDFGDEYDEMEAGIIRFADDLRRVG